MQKQNRGHIWGPSTVWLCYILQNIFFCVQHERVNDFSEFKHVHMFILDFLQNSQHVDHFKFITDKEHLVGTQN